MVDINSIDAANSNAVGLVVNAIQDFAKQLTPVQPQLTLKPDDNKAWETVKDTARAMYWDPATEKALVSRLGQEKVDKFKQIMGW